MQRTESFDILKGFGIIFMIVAHTYGPNNLIWDFISAFHMPLFFIVAGYFYKHKSITEQLKKNYNQLIVPYITICIIVIALTQIRQPHSIKTDISCSLYGMGPGWFLLAMFWARIEFYYIQKTIPNHYFIASLIISTCICLIAYNNGISSFLYLFISPACLVFMAVGYYVREHQLLPYLKKPPFLFICLSISLWFITSIWGKVLLHQCYFKLSIIDFAGSIAGTFLFFTLSNIIAQHDFYLKNILSAAGRYSLVILFFHSIDYCVPVWHLIIPYLPSSLLIPTILVIRFLFVTMCVVITLHIKWLRLFFRIQ